MKKRVFAALTALVITASAAGCGSAGTSSSDAASTNAASEEASTEATTETSGENTETAGETQVVTLGVVGSDKDFWIPAQETLKDEGIDLQFVEFSDYTTPNNALNGGDIDLNAFQHEVYLNSEIAEHGYKIQNIGYTVMSPLNLYSQKVTSVDEIKDGDVIAVPNDTTNEGRALKVLEEAGLIKLVQGDLESPTLDDIESYKVDIKIEELGADTVASSLPDVTAAIINGNYAVDFGLTNDDAVFLDSGTQAQQYWNLVAARTADLSDPDKVALYDKVIKAFQQQATVDVFNDEFKGAYVAVGWDQDLLADYK